MLPALRVETLVLAACGLQAFRERQRRAAWRGSEWSGIWGCPCKGSYHYTTTTTATATATATTTTTTTTTIMVMIISLTVILIVVINASQTVYPKPS